MQINKETIGLIELIVSSILFGMTPIFVRFGQNLGGHNLAFFRVLIPSTVIYLAFKLTKRNITLLRWEKKKMVVFGVLNAFIILSFFLSIELLSVAHASLLLGSYSIWTIVFSYFLLGERITKNIVLALIIGFVGVILVISPQSLIIRIRIISWNRGGASFCFIKNFQKT